MIIQSTTLDTMAKVIAEYGGTSWEKIEGRFLLGQSSSYAINSTGGNKDAIIPYHYHSMTFSKSSETGYTGGTIASGASGVGYVGRVYVGGNATPSKETKNTAYAGSSGNATNANMPPYRTVYIWERTA